MQWSEPAIVLSQAPHGETSLILSLLTRDRGRQRGLARGARRGRQRGIQEPGSQVEAHWQARLAEHLGLFRLEPTGSVTALLLDDPLRLACLSAALSLTDLVLPEHEPHRDIYEALGHLLDRLAADDGWAVAELRLELTLLRDLGFGLALDQCGVTGATEGLAFVSPKTGRAVSRAAAAGYEDRLLVLPRAFGGTDNADSASDLDNGLTLTGFFLERHILRPMGAELPQARARYRDRLRATVITPRKTPAHGP